MTNIKENFCFLEVISCLQTSLCKIRCLPTLYINCSDPLNKPPAAEASATSSTAFDSQRRASVKQEESDSEVNNIGRRAM